MADTTSDYPRAEHSPINFLSTIYTSLVSFLGGTPWKHTEVHNKTENTLVQVTRDQLQRGRSVKAYGATGDGITDDTAAIAAAIDAVIADGGGVVLYPKPAVAYKQDNITRTIPADVHIALVGIGKVKILMTNTTSYQGAYTFKGTYDNVTNIQSMANVAVNLAETGQSGPGNTTVTQLTLDTQKSFVRGDIVKIIAEDLNAEDYSGNTKVGEYATVGADSTLSPTLNLSKVIFGMQSGTSIFTLSPRVARLTDCSVSMINLEFVLDPSKSITTSYYVAAVYLLGLKNCRIVDCKFTNIPGIGISNYSYATIIDSCKFVNGRNKPTLSYYSYGVEDGGDGLRMVNCTSQGGRHTYSANANAVTANTEYWYYGGCANAIIAHNYASGAQGQAFDTHDTSRNCRFIGNIADGDYIGGGSGGYGYVVRGRDHGLINCVARGCFNGFSISVTEGCFMIGCHAFEIFSVGLIVGGFNTTILTQKRIHIKDSVFESGIATTGTSRVVQLGVATHTLDMDLDNCKFIIYGVANGSRVFEFTKATVRMDGVKIDLRNFTVATNLSVFVLKDVNCNIFIKNPQIIGGACPATITAFTSDVGSNTSIFEVRDGLYTHDSAGFNTLINGNLSNPRIAFQQRFGTTSTPTWTNTRYATNAVAAATVLATALKNDDHVMLDLTGSNGDITIANLASGLFTGQRLSLYNASTGIVTIATPDVSIPVNRAITFYWTGSLWRPENNSNVLVTAPYPLTLTTGTNNNVNIGIRSLLDIQPLGAVANVTGLAAPKSGHRATFFNNSGQVVTFRHETGSATANRLRLTAGVDLALADQTAVSFVYIKTALAGDGRWVQV